MWGHLLAHLGGPYRDATTLTLADVDAYEGARRGKARGQTIRREVQSLVRGLRLAKRAGMIDAMPFDPDDLRIISSDPPKPTQQAKAWTPEEIAAVLANLSAKAITAGIGDQMRLVQVTGLRYTELKRLRASWVDGATLTVPAIDGAKTRTPRIVPLGSEALAILQKWLARSDAPFQGGKPNAALALASIRAGFANGVVPTEGPMRGKATMVSGRVLTPRDLRASYITQAGRHDPVAAQLLAGHTSIKTTSRYLHAHQDRLLAAARAAENASKVPTVGSPQQNRVVKKAQ